MSSEARNVALGCAIGCSIAVLLVVGLVGGGYLGIRKLARGADRIERGMDAVRDRFGVVTDFTPLPGGQIPAARIETFLRVRDLSSAERDRLEQTLQTLAAAERSGDSSSSPATALRTVGAGIGALPRIMGYIASRNDAFLEADMGPGEYLYIYTLVYFVWLGLPPEDGPPIDIGGDGPNRSGRSSDDVADRRRWVLSTLNRHLLPMLHNQLEAVEKQPEEQATGPGWREALAREIAKMEGDATRLPWSDGLPEALEASFVEYRERLEASYCSLCNALEVMVQQP